MDVKLIYRGRRITEADICWIRRLIEENEGASRRKLSEALCREWNWVQANGIPRDMVARGLMLLLDREGYIELPAKRRYPPNNLARHGAPERLSGGPCVARTVGLQALRPLEFRQVRRSKEESHFDSLMETYHYLGYTRPVGEHLKYLIYGGGEAIACMAWSSAPRHLECRDRFIGWTAEVRKKQLHLLGYNTRFLILPWVREDHLASHILGSMARRISRDWQQMYSHPIYFLETFVDPARFRGTCYKAANWCLLGETKGLGKAARSKRPNRSIKQIWGYPLRADFRELLGVGR